MERTNLQPLDPVTLGFVLANTTSISKSARPRRKSRQTTSTGQVTLLPASVRPRRPRRKSRCSIRRKAQNTGCQCVFAQAQAARRQKTRKRPNNSVPLRRSRRIARRAIVGPSRAITRLEPTHSRGLSDRRCGSRTRKEKPMPVILLRAFLLSSPAAGSSSTASSRG